MAIEPQQMQEGFAAPAPMESADADVGMINQEEAMPPQEGGEMSVADDIPQTADEGDYILPYETVLLHGLNQLNRYAKEAIDLAMENKVDLSGTQIDPTDDVPIRISNYEYRIPKGLVPFFGGGKKYLDKLQKEGLELRKQLEKEGQKPAASQQEAEAPITDAMQEGFAQEAPAMPPEPMPQEAMPPEAMPQEAMPPQSMPQEAMPPQGASAMPMMKKGGFVISKDKDAEILEQDTSDATNEQKRTMAQQPAMATPNGQTVKQGFSAPSGYAHGGEIHEGLGFDAKDITPKNVSQMRQNAQDALNVLSGYEKSFLTKQRTDEKLV